MNKVLVSIISEQTLPNYLFIKEFEKGVDSFLFISSESMEKKNKSRHIWQTAGIVESRVSVINIDENSLFRVKQIFDNAGLDNPVNEYLVNITGGTKLMSNAVYNYFSDQDSRVFYVPIGRNTYKEVFDNRESTELHFEYTMGVAEYLNVYGIEYKKSELIFSEPDTAYLGETFAKNGYNLKAFPQRKAAKIIRSENILQNLPGRWFEEYLYYLVKDTLNLHEKEIETGLELFITDHPESERHFHDNELDLVFLVNNNLYIVEAKVSLGIEKINMAVINNALYKLAALNKNFGLRARAGLFTLADLKKLSERSHSALMRRCELVSLFPPVDRHELTNAGELKKRLSNLTRN